MIHGSEVEVEPASQQNGYVELPPDVEDEPWARICKLYYILILYHLKLNLSISLVLFDVLFVMTL